jgi:hypothetical protein
MKHEAVKRTIIKVWDKIHNRFYLHDVVEEVCSDLYGFGWRIRIAYGKTVHPDTIRRKLSELREEERITYKCIDKKESLYEKG